LSCNMLAGKVVIYEKHFWEVKLSDDLSLFP